MDLKFTNRAIKSLFADTGIDLMKLDGDTITDYDKRVSITKAGSSLPSEEVECQCADMTPGEHIDLLQIAIRRDMLPPSLREAQATTKSEPATATT